MSRSRRCWGAPLPKLSPTIERRNELQQLISEEGGVLIPYVAPLLQAVRKNVHGYIPALPTAAHKIWVG